MVYTRRSKIRFYDLYFQDILYAYENGFQTFTFTTLQKKGQQTKYNMILELILDHHEIFFSEVTSKILFEGGHRTVYCETTIIFE